MALRTDAEARDRAQLILGAVSLVLWFAVAFGLAIAWYVDDNTPQPIFMAGGIALIVAALPWLAYRPLVRRFRKARAHPRGT
ncbi:MAG TPA: hypothetical protein VKV73_01955 [Chloroflexota bacterium]|nr:hypothetical protein [Chloroflexota bacterium]